MVDHQEYIAHNQDLDLVYRICKDVANVMNALYSPLNIYIALVGVVVWTEFDEIKLSSDGDTTLKNFLNYRKERLVKVIIWLWDTMHCLPQRLKWTFFEIFQT